MTFNPQSYAKAGAKRDWPPDVVFFGDQMLKGPIKNGRKQYGIIGRCLAVPAVPDDAILTLFLPLEPFIESDSTNYKRFNKNGQLEL
jgi:hypothetical protein